MQLTAATFNFHRGIGLYVHVCLQAFIFREEIPAHLECNVLEFPASYDKHIDLSHKHVLNRKVRANPVHSFLTSSSVLSYAGLLIKVCRPLTL
jgi:hypothetical protein